MPNTQPDAARERGDLLLTVHYLRLSKDAVLAVTTLGGINLRGERGATPFDAIRSLFAGLSGSPAVSSHQDAAIALDLALAGETIHDLAGAESSSVAEQAALTAGDVDAPAGDELEAAAGEG